MADINAQEAAVKNEIKYRRSSLYTMIIDYSNAPFRTPIKEYGSIIKSSFETSPHPDKFNNHNLQVRTIPVARSKNQKKNITAFLETNNIARDLVAKWFNRSDKGGFDMELVKSRGNYDASVLDVMTAKASKRGTDMLADAGEGLINKTFLLVSDHQFYSKEHSAETMLVFGRGFMVRTTVHLYQLDWNEEVAAYFYNNLWADDSSITPEKKAAFDNTDIFTLKYIGTDVTLINEGSQRSLFKKIKKDQFIKYATVKATDEVIVKLQKKHDQFKTKSPLFTGDPITAKIGLKEGVSEQSTFDVLEQQIDADGIIKYTIIGSVKVDDNYPIWDNRYGATEAYPDSNAGTTHFTKISGPEFHTGMLIVQKKGK